MQAQDSGPVVASNSLLAVAVAVGPGLIAYYLQKASSSGGSDSPEMEQEMQMVVSSGLVVHSSSLGWDTLERQTASCAAALAACQALEVEMMDKDLQVSTLNWMFPAVEGVGQVLVLDAAAFHEAASHAEGALPLDYPVREQIGSEGTQDEVILV